MNRSTLAALVALAGVPSGLHADSLPTAGVPQSCGVNIHYRPIPDNLYKQFADFGFGCSRSDLNWQRVESKRGEYDFSLYDALIAQVLKAGTRPLFVLDYGNPLYTPDTAGTNAVPGPPPPPRTDEARAAFVRFAAAAAAHFKGKGVIWELWNEPDGSTFWKPSPSAEEYSAFMIDAAKAIHEADPSTTIIGPALGGLNQDYLRTVFKHGMLRYIDGVSWHPYRRTAPETADGDYAIVRKLIAQYTRPGDPIRPVIASEWGYSTTPKWKVTEQMQASYVLREWLANMECGVDLTIYYDYHDDGPNIDDQEHNFGLLHNDYTPKPSGAAVKEFFAKLDGYRFAHRLPGASPTDWKLLFYKGSDLAIVSWDATYAYADTVKTPTVTTVSPTDLAYRNLLRTKSIAYTDALQEGSVYVPVTTAVTVTNPDSKPATVVVSAGPAHAQATLKPGESRTLEMRVQPSVPAGATRTVPVTATWNAEAVTGLPPLKVATADVMNVALSPTAKGFTITADSISFPFHGTLRITNGGKTKSVPLDLDGGATRDLTVSGDPGLPTTVAAVSAKGEVVAQTPLRHFVLLGGMPKAVSDPSGFDIVPCPKNIPAPPTPATNVPGGDGAPSDATVSMPYVTTPTWLYTLLKPHGADAIPNDAVEIVVWVKSSGDKSHINARYIDATGQTFQPGMGNLDFEGWKVLRYPLRGITYCWGGAGDGVQHLPLKLDSLVNIDGTRLPDSQKTVLVGPAYYAIDDTQAVK